MLSSVFLLLSIAILQLLFLAQSMFVQMAILFVKSARKNPAHRAELPWGVGNLFLLSQSWKISSTSGPAGSSRRRKRTAGGGW